MQHRLEAGMQKKDQASKWNVQVEPSKLLGHVLDQDNTRNRCQVQVARCQTQVARSSAQAWTETENLGSSA
jgi:hypothetical protein